MADDQPKDRDDAAGKQRGAPADSTEALESNEVDVSSWSNLWQVPAIVLSVGLILLGLENIPFRKAELSTAGS